MKRLIYLLSIAISLVACESMEDTYSEYNTPKERYVGKCSDLVLEQGWNRFRLTWTNSVDAAIENIKVKWEGEKESPDSVILAAGTEVYETLPVFTNQSYKFTVTAIDNRGVESFPVEVYGKPFTASSSLIEMFSTVEKKFFFVDEELIVMLYEAGGDIYNAEISYTSGGEAMTRAITSEDFELGRLQISGVDAGSDVTMSGTMNLTECIDEIPVEPYVLDREKRSWSGAFIGAMREQFDMQDVSDEQLDTLTTLYIDYNVNSLEDILYLPNLEHVVLGKRRMNSASTYISSASYVSKITDVDASLFALRKMHDIKGITVDIYGNQFLIKDSLDFETLHSTNPPPAVSVPADASSWVLTINNPDYYENEDPADNHPYELENMLGSYNDWQSIPQSGTLETHEITYDMNELKEVKGFQFYQSTSRFVRSYLPSTIEVHVSADGDKWETAFYQATMNVGGAPGEVTIAHMAEPKTVRYIKMIVRDVESSSTNYVAIGNFVPVL
ncbi:DUF4998 domain-containing protein [Mangrovibacterium diazotrophicum]|uniref:F5/8 type C domain-containing protein n=1 Tax=Mangrovibacterium diazotrophicum TaxID=1261403 RepID=A0A419VUF0_9BACT|nr:DUF4998 domain-containing protein [Mangrovibacterium diazotrophicum]RKD85148.1 F5/8 type C domain-containing protein [Mangrovibacterium diazotrophicum]